MSMRLLVGRVARRSPARAAPGSSERRSDGAGRGGAPATPYRPRCGDVARPPRRARGSGSAGPRRRARRIAEEEMSRRGMSKKRTRSRAARGRSQALGDLVAADALALGDGERGELAAAPRARASVGRLARHVASDDEGQVVLRRVGMDLPEGIHRVRRARPVDLAARDREPLRPRRPPARTARSAPRRPGRRRPPCAAACGPASAPPGRGASWSSASCAHDEVPDVRRVERPSEDADRGHALRAAAALRGGLWPSPCTTYLVEHSSRSPIGPRAWSFWVELPISAPMPNSPPSVKRVDALT